MSQSVLTETGLSARQLCRAAGLGYATYCRWSRRQREGEPLLLHPGPRKAGPLPMDELLKDLQALVHGPKRTRGTGALCRKWRPFAGRRPLAGCVKEERLRRHRLLRLRLRRVRWLEPDLAWAIDATEYPRDVRGQRPVHVVVQDLATTFQFEPEVAPGLDGHQAARCLRHLFRRHGTPLFLKRDNGGVFNTPEVDALLAVEGVLPLNSPVRYPRYNGAVEHGIGELKRELHPELCLPARWTVAGAALLARLLVHKHNHYPRRSLGGRSATEAYFQDQRTRWNRSQRQAIFTWITSRTRRILSAMDHPNRPDLRRAWRRSAEAWLRCQGLIEVSKPKQTVTPFHSKK